MRVEFEFRKTANLLWHTVTVGIFPLILALGACGGSGSGPRRRAQAALLVRLPITSTKPMQIKLRFLKSIRRRAQ